MCYPTKFSSCTCPKGCSESYCESVCQLWGYDTEAETCEYDCGACGCGAYGRKFGPPPVQNRLTRLIGWFATEAFAAETPPDPKEGRIETPHGTFLSISASEFRDQMSGTIGLRVRAEGEGIIVASVVKGSSAHKAGIRKGNRIISIDGFSTRGMKAQKAAGLLRGKPGTMVVLRLKTGILPWGKKVVVIRSIDSYSENAASKRKPRIRALNVPLEELGRSDCPARRGDCEFYKFSPKSRVCVYTCRD